MQKILSVFIDESGDFGKYSEENPYYLITMVFHEQSHSIVSAMKKLNEQLQFQGYLTHSLHTGPLIRKEEKYIDLTFDERRKIFASFIHFTRNVDITYKTFILKKRPSDNERIIIISLSQLIRNFLSQKKDLNNYEKIVVYYDNGQIQLTHIIRAVFEDPRTSFRTVKPYNYRLFQIADLITTMELINLKKLNNHNSKSEIAFFGSMNKFHKNYYKTIQKKRLD